MNIVSFVFSAVALCAEVRIQDAYADLPIGAATMTTRTVHQKEFTPAQEVWPSPGNTWEENDDDTTTRNWQLPDSSTTVEEPLIETLEQAWLLATANHPLLQARQHKIAAADHRLRASRAGFRPRLTMASGYTVRDREPGVRLQDIGLPLTSNRFSLAQDEELSARARVSLPLYTSGRISHNVAAAEANRSIADHELFTEIIELKLNVAIAYTSVMRAQRDVYVSKCRATNLEAHLREVSSLRDQLRVRQHDLLVAQVKVNTARHREVQTTNRYEIALAEYNRLLGRPLGYLVEMAELRPPMLQFDLDSLTHQAIMRRPELSSLALQSQSLAEQAGEARAASKPRVDLLGEYAFEENRFQDPQGIASAAVVVSWNILDGGRTRHMADSLAEESASLAMIRRDRESSIRLEVRSAWLDYQESVRRISISKQTILQAEESLRISKENFAAGIATNTEVLDAVTLQAETQRDYHHATYDAVLAELRIRRAVGGF